MNREQRRAHLALHGQTLLDEWQERCKAMDKIHKLWAEGKYLMGEGDVLLTDTVPKNHTYAQRKLLLDKGRECYAQGYRLRIAMDAMWERAVLDAFGEIEIVWGVDGSCTLGVGERYEP